LALRTAEVLRPQVWILVTMRGSGLLGRPGIRPCSRQCGTAGDQDGRRRAAPAPARRRRGQARGLLDRTAGCCSYKCWRLGRHDFADQQQADPDIGPALRWIVDGTGRPEWAAVESCSPFLRSLWQQYESLVLRDGALYSFHLFLIVIFLVHTSAVDYAGTQRLSALK
jgi:hypothetical protein